MIERANQKQTSKSNPRKARAAVKRKLEKLKDANIITSHSKEGEVYKVKPKSQRSSSKKSS